MNFGALPSGVSQVGKNSGAVDPWSMEGAFGKNGWGMAGIAGLSGLAQGILGAKEVGLGKDALNFQKESFDKNFQASTQNYNTNLMNSYFNTYNGADAATKANMLTPEQYASMNKLQGGANTQPMPNQQPNAPQGGIAGFGALANNNPAGGRTYG